MTITDWARQIVAGTSASDGTVCGKGEELDRLGIVLTALVTSSIVTLTVEYVTKARLELRTHRTVEMVRVRLSWSGR